MNEFDGHEQQSCVVGECNTVLRRLHNSDCHNTNRSNKFKLNVKRVAINELADNKRVGENDNSNNNNDNNSNECLHRRMEMNDSDNISCNSNSCIFDNCKNERIDDNVNMLHEDMHTNNSFCKNEENVELSKVCVQEIKHTYCNVFVADSNTKRCTEDYNEANLQETRCVNKNHNYQTKCASNNNNTNSDSYLKANESNASMQYGGGIIRISDLRARGETFLESGLNLKSINKLSREQYKNNTPNNNHVTCSSQNNNNNNNNNNSITNTNSAYITSVTNYNGNNSYRNDLLYNCEINNYVSNASREHLSEHLSFSHNSYETMESDMQPNYSHANKRPCSAVATMQAENNNNDDDDDDETNLINESWQHAPTRTYKEERNMNSGKRKRGSNEGCTKRERLKRSKKTNVEQLCRARHNIRGAKSNRNNSDNGNGNNNNSSDYHWYTVNGRRRLVVDGKTYRGRTAHQMWSKLKKESQKAARYNVSTLSASKRITNLPEQSNLFANAHVATQQSRKQLANNPCITSTTNIKSNSELSDFIADVNHNFSNTEVQYNIKCTNSENNTIKKVSCNTREQQKPCCKGPAQLLHVKMPLTPNALDMLRMPKLPLITTTSPVTPTHHEASHVRTLEQIFNITPYTIESNTANNKSSKSVKNNVDGDRIINEIEGSNDDDDDDDRKERKKSNTCNENIFTKTTSARNAQATKEHDSSFTEFSSVSSFSTTSDDYDSTCDSSSFDDTDYKLDNTSNNNNNNNNIPNAESKNSFSEHERTLLEHGRIRNIDGQEVVEYDGWVYPIDVFTAMQEASLVNRKSTELIANINAQFDTFHQEKNDSTKLETSLQELTENATKANTHAGLHVLGGATANKLTHAECKCVQGKPLITLNTTVCAMRPLIDEGLYTNHDVFDGLDSRELAGMFETGDEVGGVRYTVLEIMFLQKVSS